VKFKKTPYAKAKDKWFASEDGMNCQTASILRYPCDSEYLRNRLDRAFYSGWNAAMKEKGTK
jgi:hypothetical protein